MAGYFLPKHHKVQVFRSRDDLNKKPFMKSIQFDNAAAALQEDGKFFNKTEHTTFRMNCMKAQTISNILKAISLHFLILFLSFNYGLAEIKNGYEKDILALKESLKSLTEILNEDEDLSGIQRRKIESKVEALVNHISFYDLTETLLSQFRIIAPKLYAEVDTISDRKGRPVHVYVKFVPFDATKVKAWGLTYLNQVENDKDAYLSEYGAFTVSIKIWIVPKSLLVLSHELGHVKYQIPNLASYMTFHKKCYQEVSNFTGHNSADPSGKSAIQSEKLFRKEYAYFLKNTNEKIQSPVILLTKIRKNMSQKHYAAANTWRPTVTM
jgi:hypothetical protein